MTVPACPSTAAEGGEGEGGSPSKDEDEEEMDPVMVRRKVREMVR